MPVKTRTAVSPGGRFKVNLVCLLAASLLAMLIADVSLARAIRVDGTLQSIVTNVGDETVNDGSTGPLPIQSYEEDTTTGQPDFDAPLPFDINFFGEFYNEFYINENGNITFDAPFSGRPGDSDLSNTGMPILAPFFADVDMALGGRIFNGFFPLQNAIAITWTSADYFGQPDGEGNDMQIVIFDRSDVTGVAGDFDLEFNYRAGPDGMLWETGDRDGGVNGFGGASARVGFYDGFGTGYEIAGSGVPGALTGGDCLVNPLALNCNDYFFQFRGGLPYQDGRLLISVPEPGSLALFVTGLAIMVVGARRRVRPLHCASNRANRAGR